MPSSTKKFLYGLLYLSLFAVIGLVIFLAARPSRDTILYPASRPVSDVPDISSTQFSIQPLFIEEQEVFRLRSVEPAFLFGKVYNPNSEYGASRFSYTFSLFGADGKLLEQVSGEAGVLPERETLLSGVSTKTSSRDVDTVRLSLSDAEWAPASQFLEHVFLFPSEPRIEIDDAAREMRVVGTVRNETTSRIAEARVLVALRDSFGFRVFVSGTILSNLRSFSNKEFAFSIPYDEDLARRVREGAVEVYFYPVF